MHTSRWFYMGRLGQLGHLLGKLAQLGKGFGISIAFQILVRRGLQREHTVVADVPQGLHKAGPIDGTLGGPEVEIPITHIIVHVQHLDLGAHCPHHIGQA